MPASAFILAPTLTDTRSRVQLQCDAYSYAKTLVQSMLPPSQSTTFAYNSVAPRNVLRSTAAVQTKGARPKSPAMRDDAAPAEDVAEPVALEEPVAVAVTVPLPAEAVPEDAPPASCEPDPAKPGPVPAPLVM